MSGTDFLFVGPSFLHGLARAADIGAAFRHYSYDLSPSEAEADGKAVASDWQVVGRDLSAALDAYRAESRTE